MCIFIKEITGPKYHEIFERIAARFPSMGIVQPNKTRNAKKTHKHNKKRTHVLVSDHDDPAARTA